eukprot:scaffold95346_cov66-Phaeocystis_antarctica.AAC.1
MGCHQRDAADAHLEPDGGEQQQLGCGDGRAGNEGEAAEGEGAPVEGVEVGRLRRGHASALGGVGKDPRAVGDLTTDAERHEHHERCHDGELHIGLARAEVDPHESAGAARLAQAAGRGLGLCGELGRRRRRAMQERRGEGGGRSEAADGREAVHPAARSPLDGDEEQRRAARAEAEARVDQVDPRAHVAP